MTHNEMKEAWKRVGKITCWPYSFHNSTFIHLNYDRVLCKTHDTEGIANWYEEMEDLYGETS